VVGRLIGNGHRFLANEKDEATLMQLASETREQIGRKGWVCGEKGGMRNLFSFDVDGKL